MKGIFQLSGLSFPGGDQDLFGVWDVAPAASSVSFGVGAAEPEVAVWGANLPGSHAEAQALLQARQEAVRQQQAELINIERRLAQLAQPGESVSFAVGASGPDADLLAAINRYDPTSVSYGLRDWIKQNAQDRAEVEASSQWRGFLDQVRDKVMNYARVGTTVDGAPLGSTAVSWAGDFKTVWVPSVTAADMQLHYQNVNFALASRLALMRLVGVVGAGAANIAVKLTVPGGQLLVLPAVWKFVRDVMAEWRNLQASKDNGQ